MGILGEPLAYLVDLQHKLPPKFSVCELGDQWITEGERRLARDFYKHDMGCGRYESIDGNGRGTITADLNRPLNPRLHGAFNLVTDFGTGEHVFNQYQVFKTIHDLCAKDGFIVFDRPTQGYPVHCYWNANQCLWDDVATANDYEVLEMSSRDTTRGRLIRGVMRKTTGKKFHIPQQGRYKKLLRPITEVPSGSTAEKV